MRKTFSVTADATHCSTCMLSDLCLPLGMSHEQRTTLDQLIKERIQLQKATALFRLGDKVEAVYAIRSGSIKTQLEDASGQVQITGFLLPGEITGLDGLADMRQPSNAIAMENTEVCVIRLDEMDLLAQHLPVLQQQFRRLMSKEIQRSQQMAMSMGGLRSEQRIALFLLNMSQRLSALGYSSTEFLLRMSRENLGNYLGLTLETVSRLLSRFGRDGLIRIHQREVQLLDMQALQKLAGATSVGC
ncbi:helix-turn-helix domain-containing protein [Paralcaligenes sp. KSB-10]|jgi:CRP/FNR family transcriptional regulator|uniref:helix-turn-helix domain-containing protein n=1 Tax=Paralcaligenes sp. KSB-10 TaxID=2901142 RepID=UPI001E4D35A4|nr:helix-turn-helix domain-containing protein [Paralcaligenes sp. KSB-10]UHL65697.1 helix-turn-helix domain-containing protein [Paralcaligenes sp. KSB-10]